MNIDDATLTKQVGAMERLEAQKADRELAIARGGFALEGLR